MSQAKVNQAKGGSKNVQGPRVREFRISLLKMAATKVRCLTNLYILRIQEIPTKKLAGACLKSGLTLEPKESSLIASFIPTPKPEELFQRLSGKELGVAKAED